MTSQHQTQNNISPCLGRIWSSPDFVPGYDNHLNVLRKEEGQGLMCSGFMSTNVIMHCYLQVY